MTSLQLSHDAFSRALWQVQSNIHYPASISAPNDAVESRFTIYRNNVWSSLINSLSDSYEVVLKLVGAPFFNALAQRYIIQHPPTSAIMSQWGGEFAAFIKQDIYCESLPYLADLAQLEWLRIQTYHALDEKPLSTEKVQAFLVQHIDELMDCKIELLAACKILNSNYCCISIWNLHQQYYQVSQFASLEKELLALDFSQAESALIWRNQLVVEVIPIERPFGYLLTLLKQGQTIGQAVSECLADFPDLEISVLLSFILQLPCILTVQQSS